MLNINDPLLIIGFKTNFIPVQKYKESIGPGLYKIQAYQEYSRECENADFSNYISSNV